MNYHTVLHPYGTFPFPLLAWKHDNLTNSKDALWHKPIRTSHYDQSHYDQSHTGTWTWWWYFNVQFLQSLHQVLEFLFNSDSLKSCIRLSISVMLISWNKTDTLSTSSLNQLHKINFEIKNQNRRAYWRDLFYLYFCIWFGLFILAWLWRKTSSNLFLLTFYRYLF